jgi:hypothetical protein
VVAEAVAMFKYDFVISLEADYARKTPCLYPGGQSVEAGVIFNFYFIFVSILELMVVAEAARGYIEV